MNKINTIFDSKIAFKWLNFFVVKKTYLWYIIGNKEVLNKKIKTQFSYKGKLNNC